jgi:hypothetical protein
MIILYLYNYIKSKLNGKLYIKNNNQVLNNIYKNDNEVLNNIYKNDKILITIYEDIELV